jgi:hypothetical protein
MSHINSSLSHDGHASMLSCLVSEWVWARARVQAYGVLCSAAVPRPAGSSFMPLRRVPHRPVPVGGFGISQHHTNQVGYRSGCSVWRSEIKEEPSTLGRRGGHSRSHTLQPPRCTSHALKLITRRVQ